MRLFRQIFITHVQPCTLTLLIKQKKKIQIMQYKMYHISEEHLRSINWLPTNKRVNNECINTIIFKFVNSTCPYYLKEIERICSKEIVE